MKINAKLPDFIIIGAQKCATTSLYYYLNLHPQIFMAHEKELSFFSHEKNWRKGVSWYMNNFCTDRVCGEASPQYTHYPFFANVPQRIQSVAPNTKLIYIIRDPIERIISNYLHDYIEGKENRTFVDVISSENNYISRSKYYMQIQQYLPYFSSDKLLVILTEELNNFPQKTLQKIFRFLDVDQDFFSTKFMKHKHKTCDKRRNNNVGKQLKEKIEKKWINLIPYILREKIKYCLYFPFSYKVNRFVLTNELHQKLSEQLHEDIISLRKYTNYSFEEWNI